jgi:large subunit ribosomal protein L32
MGVPKKRTSRQKRDQRRASNFKISAPNVQKCPKCGEPTLPHRACPKCGEYKGRAVQKSAED